MTKLTDMPNDAITSIYRSNKMYDRAVCNKQNIMTVPHNGKHLATRAKPVPPVAEYDAWLRGRNERIRSGPHTMPKTGFKLRRIVIMRRQGSSWKECAEAVGMMCGSAAKEWVEFLPLHLGV